MATYRDRDGYVCVYTHDVYIYIYIYCTHVVTFTYLQIRVRMGVYCMYAYIQLQTHMHLQTHLICTWYAYACMCVHVLTYAWLYTPYTCTCRCNNLQMPSCIQIHMLQIHAGMHTETHAPTCTYMYMFEPMCIHCIAMYQGTWYDVTWRYVMSCDEGSCKIRQFSGIR